MDASMLVAVNPTATTSAQRSSLLNRMESLVKRLVGIVMTTGWIAMRDLGQIRTVVRRRGMRAPELNGINPEFEFAALER